ncbi:hypothetical protein ALC62_14295 [Cyphomyrmex costatus]|uniref:Uncharacterized protein n=1 Tax=Cyphomyrmex costatus TaxID=456900 RepID=A0A151I9A6_9HYME|nr:hypothetical protein ALC62_14295 [Cyphomyrmex costatus]
MRIAQNVEVMQGGNVHWYLVRTKITIVTFLGLVLQMTIGKIHPRMLYVTVISLLISIFHMKDYSFTYVPRKYTVKIPLANFRRW